MNLMAQTPIHSTIIHHQVQVVISSLTLKGGGRLINPTSTLHVILTCGVRPSRNLSSGCLRHLPHPLFSQQFYCWGSLLRKGKWPQSPTAPVNLVSRLCPPAVLFFSCPSSRVYVAWPRLPAGLQSLFSCCLSFLSFSLLVVVLSFSLVLFFSSWRAPLTLSCCPFGVVRSQLVLLLSSSWCVPVAFLPSSFCLLLSSSCPPLVFCCPASVARLRCFRDRGWRCGNPPPQQQLLLTKPPGGLR